MNRLDYTVRRCLRCHGDGTHDGMDVCPTCEGRGTVTVEARPVVRETAAVDRGRPILIKLEVGGKLIRLKQKGRRQWYSVGVEQVYALAVRMRMAEVAAEKKAAKAARKRGR